MEVRESPSGSTLTLTVTLNNPAPVHVEYGAQEGDRLQITSEPATTHTLILGRLKPGRRHWYRVVSGGDTVQGEAEVPPLPVALEGLVRSRTGHPSSPLVLLEAGMRPGWRGLVAVDQAGDVVWYCETPGIIHGAARRRTGSWVVVDPTFGLREMSPACETLATRGRTPGRTIHHDVVEAPDGSILYLTREVGEDSIQGDFIRRWIPETGADEEVWSSFQQLDWETDRGPRSRPRNWLHANSLAVGPRGNIVIGLAHLNQVVSIRPDFSGFEWRMGGPNATHPLDGDLPFLGQHTAAEVETNRILLFDNDPTGQRRWSRAVEYELGDGLAREVWSFRPPTDNWSRVQSSARRLENGNTMVHFGASSRQSSSSGPIEIYEVTPTGDVVWHMVVGESFHAAYRATPISTIAGEVLVSR